MLPEAKPATKRILVVEDSASTRDALAALLMFEGYTVATASNGAEAIDLLPGLPRFSAILLDLMMPEMDGFAFLSERARNPDLAAMPVVVMSARDPGGGDMEGVRGLHYLRKPVDIEALLQLLRRTC